MRLGLVVQESGTATGCLAKRVRRHRRHRHRSNATVRFSPVGFRPFAEGKRLLVLVRQRKALGIAVRNDRPQRRYSGLLASLRSKGRLAVALA